jgi:hypothetical protein
MIGGNTSRSEERLDGGEHEAVTTGTYDVDLVAMGLYLGIRRLLRLQGDWELDRFRNHVPL